MDTGSLCEHQTLVFDALSPPAVEASLEVAIGTASIHELRRLLLDITNSNESAKNLAMHRLLTPIAVENSSKCKAFETCKNCAEEYQVVNNTNGDCAYHPGTRSLET